MSALTIELPDSLEKDIEARAVKAAYAVNQFPASAAAEKLAATAVAHLRREAAAGRREEFECYLKAVPDVEPTGTGRLV